LIFDDTNYLFIKFHFQLANETWYINLCLPIMRSKIGNKKQQWKLLTLTLARGYLSSDGFLFGCWVLD
jgi:hypothetical protein